MASRFPKIKEINGGIYKVTAELNPVQDPEVAYDMALAEMHTRDKVRSRRFTELRQRMSSVSNTVMTHYIYSSIFDNKSNQGLAETAESHEQAFGRILGTVMIRGGENNGRISDIDLAWDMAHAELEIYDKSYDIIEIQASSMAEEAAERARGEVVRVDPTRYLDLYQTVRIGTTV